MERRGQVLSMKYVVLGLILITVALAVIGGSSRLIPNTFGIVGEETEATEGDFEDARGDPTSSVEEDSGAATGTDTSDTSTDTDDTSTTDDTSGSQETDGDESQETTAAIQASFQGDDGVAVQLNPSDTSGQREVDVALRVNNAGENRIVDRKTVTCRGPCQTSFGFTPQQGDAVTVEAQTSGPDGPTLLGRDEEVYGAENQDPLCSVTLWSDEFDDGDRLQTAGGSTLHMGDSASSIKIKGGSACEATLFQHAQYDGNSVTIDDDIDNLGGFGEDAPWLWCRGDWGNCISSLKISGGDSCRATLYDDTDYEGDTLTVTDDSSSLHLGDDVSSIEGVSCDIAIYEDEGFDGPYMRTDGDIRSFSDVPSGGAPSFSDNEVSSLTTLNGRIEIIQGPYADYTSETGSDDDDEDWYRAGSSPSSITVRRGQSLTYRIPGHFDPSYITLTSPQRREDASGGFTVEETGQIPVAYEWNDTESEEIERPGSITGEDDNTGAYTAHHELNSLPRSEKPDGTFRVLTAPIGFGPGTSLNQEAGAIDEVIEEESVFSTCQSPEESVQVVALADECSNNDVVQDVCQQTLTETATGSGSSQGACSRDCADAIIQCAASYAEEHNLEWDKAHGILQTDWNAPSRVSGCAPKADLLNDNEGAQRGGSVTLKPRSNDGITGSHEIGHDFGLCHGQSEDSWEEPLSIRPCRPSEDSNCNPACDPEENEDCTQDYADAFGTCRGCESSHCPNNDAADQDDIMNYQDGRIFMPQENQHLETHPQLESIVDQCREE